MSGVVDEGEAELEPEMSDDEHAMWEEAGEDLTPPKTLSRVIASQEFVVDNITKVGTLLAGVSGITAAVAIDRTTWFVSGIPVIPLGALLTTLLAGTAVLLSFIARRPKFSYVNINDAYDVRAYYDSVTTAGKRMLGASWTAFLLAVIAALVTAVLAAIAAIADPPNDPTDGPRNQTSFGATVGDKGAVTLKVGGAISNIPEGRKVAVEVVAAGEANKEAGGALISTVLYPDDSGKVTLDLEGQAPASTSEAKATIVVTKGSTREHTYTLSTEFAEVPAAASPATSDQTATEKGSGN